MQSITAGVLSVSDFKARSYCHTIY